MQLNMCVTVNETAMNRSIFNVLTSQPAHVKSDMTSKLVSTWHSLLLYYV